MSDFLKSAMGYFNTGTNNGSDNDFVGQIVEVGSVKLRVKRTIAEGKRLYSLTFMKTIPSAIIDYYMFCVYSTYMLTFA